MKDTDNKIQGFTDLPLLALQEVTKRLQENKDYNGGKYSRDNHTLPLKNNEMLDAIQRHWLAYTNGEDMDPSTNTSHLTAIATNALLMEEQRLLGTLVENRLCKITNNESNWYIAEINKEMAKKLYQHIAIFKLHHDGGTTLISKESDLEDCDRFFIENSSL